MNHLYEVRFLVNESTDFPNKTIILEIVKARLQDILDKAELNSMTIYEK